MLAPPTGGLGYHQTAELAGAVGGHLVDAKLLPLGPTLSGTHLPGALAGARLLVLIVRRLGL